jgi:TM2 domain-containing membrane protein YozV
MAFCPSCGNEVNENAVVCVKCGVAVNNKTVSNQIGPVSDKEWLMTLMLCIFLGAFGIHRFYTGKTGTAIAMLLTLGGCGIWTLIDIIMIATGSFKDANDLPLKK